jgi:uncharacterized protein (DUF2141 family)
MTQPSPNPQPTGRRKSILAGLSLALLAIAVAAAARSADPAAKPSPAPAREVGLASLTVAFHGLKSQAGTVMLTLSSSLEAYADKASFTAQAGVAVGGDIVAITFERLKPGRYAIKAFHDLNGDGKLNTNPFGIPTEPYAFSNNARGMMGPPGWEAAAFEVKAGANGQTIDID